jgi:type IV pilus assembly protein PilW
MKPLDSMHILPQRGFSLPEIMIGMVIGMIGIIVIMQVTSVFEKQKSTTTSGDDAQNGGAIALYGMQKEISQAGWGITSPLLSGRPLQAPFTLINQLFPIMVNPPQLAGIGDPNTDTLMLVYGSSNTPEGGKITNNNKDLPYKVIAGTGTGQPGDGGKGFAVGDWVIPAQSGVLACTAGPNCITAQHDLYQVVNPGGVADVVAVNGSPPLVNSSLLDLDYPLLFNLGATPAITAYAVINGSLSVCDYFNNDCAANAAAWQQLAGNIVSMRVLCESSSGVRIALVTRGAQRDTRDVTNAPPTWNPQNAVADVIATPDNWGADWRKYRYKTFETVIPIRTAIWTGALGC